MKEKTEQINELVRSVKNLHLALLVGMCIFWVVSLAISINGTIINDPELELPLLVMSIVFSITAIIAAKYIFDKRLDEINSGVCISKKLEAYRSALIMKYALYEGPVFLNLVIFLFFGNKIILGLATMMIIKYGYERPNFEKTTKDLFMDECQVENRI